MGSVLGASAHSPAERSDGQRAHQPPDAQQQQPAGKETAIDTKESFPADEQPPETVPAPHHPTVFSSCITNCEQHVLVLNGVAHDDEEHSPPLHVDSEEQGRIEGTL